MSKPNLTGIKNIIFDFGRVLLNINPLLTQTALLSLGFRPDSNNKGAKDDEIVQQLESGRISGKAFVDTVLAVTAEGTTAEQVISAWNAMLLDFPEAHVETLKKLRKDYNIYLLSNSNQIHYDSYIRISGKPMGLIWLIYLKRCGSPTR
jgi:glucose-1-phosphatase